MIQANGGQRDRHDGPLTISTEQVHLQFTVAGLPRRLDLLGLSVPLYPAGELEDGLTALHLRIRNAGEPFEVRPLVGLGCGGTIRWTTDGPVTTTHHPGGLTARVALRAATDTAGWFWHVALSNGGSEPIDCDVVAVQDVALAPYGAVRTNEYYVCQYLDVSPVPVPGHGTALAVRQNMPGEQQPWAIVGCTGSATRWASDALQLTGRERLDGEPWPGLRTDLPGTRLQHEHTVTALQTDPLRLLPGGTETTGFFGLVLADHPAATSDADARWADVVLADPAAVAGDLTATDDTPGGDGEPIVSSLFALAEALRCRAVDPDPTLGVVTAAEQRAVLRPHGHLMRTGAALVPDERTVTTTSWMAGSFLSQVTQGHASAGGILSVRRSYLGLFSSHGLRIFVAPARISGTEAAAALQDWRLLATPSRWTQQLDGCRWEYLCDDEEVARGLPRTVVVEVAAPTDAHELRLTVESDSPVTLLVTQQFVGAGDDGAADGAVAAQTDSAGTTVSVGTGTVRLEWPERSVSRVAGGDSLRMAAVPREPPDRDPESQSSVDHRDQGGLPFLTLAVPSITRWALTITPDLVPVEEVIIPANDLDPNFWAAADAALTLASSTDSVASQELSRINQVLPWYAHDALIHYLSPRGLEQFTGGAWGTRDVSQGPVGLLLAWDAHDSLREVCVLLLRAQQARGDWPQSFEFYPRHVSHRQSDAHGDVVYWPLLAIAEYLAATADGSLLTQFLPFVGDGALTAPDSVVAHLEAALDFVESTMIPGTALPAYGHGDWNDSLQPADPALAAGLCSTWTVVLQAHALRTLASALDAVPDTGARTQSVAVRARRIADDGAGAALALLVRDGVMAGYGYFAHEPGPRRMPARRGGTSRDPGSDDTTAPTELLVHPSDIRTGLTYSVLPMIHAISGDLLTREQAAHHLDLIAEHLTGPDGARLFDVPARYHGGEMEVFQRAEASTFFGREIGIMYTHAHLRYAEALARFGDAAGFLRALALANPIGMTERVPSARPRQQTSYTSSSDGVFPDRYAAAQDYRGILDGTVELEAGWRVYSSGPGIYLRLVRENLLGIRHRAARVEVDPVLDPALGDISATVRLLGRRVHLRYHCGSSGVGVLRVSAGGRDLRGTQLQNPYRAGGLAIETPDLLSALDSSSDILDVQLR